MHAPTSRRAFLARCACSCIALPAIAKAAPDRARSDDVRVAVVGLGGIKIPGSVGGRGRQIINGLLKVPGVTIAALCDVDRDILADGVRSFEQRGVKVAAHADYRRVLDDPGIDAVFLATPNHWHALGTVWACQAGKDVYVEKPFSYDIWEGRQMVAAARRFHRMVQAGTQRRSSEVLAQAFEALRGGQLGAIRSAHALVFRPRDPIGKVTAPTPPPPSLDFDLWSGPAPADPIRRAQLHYDWHWVWPTGNGEVGNNGTHMIDVCRWAIGQNSPPPRALSIGARFAFDDDGQTPNTHVILLEYRPVPILCEIRNVRAKADDPDAMGSFRNQNRGVIIECDGGHFAGDSAGGAFFDTRDAKIREFRGPRRTSDLDVAHLANFIEAVRTRKADALVAEADISHRSTVGCHMANLSHRLGQSAGPDAIRDAIGDRPQLRDAFERCVRHLEQNGIDPRRTPATLGAWIEYDAGAERFLGESAQDALRLSRRANQRAPYAVPEIAPETGG